MHTGFVVYSFIAFNYLIFLISGKFTCYKIN